MLPGWIQIFASDFFNLFYNRIGIYKFTANLKTVSERLNQQDIIVGVLLNDPSAAFAIKTTLNNLETSSKKLDENLKELQYNFLLRRFLGKKAKENNQ